MYINNFFFESLSFKDLPPLKYPEKNLISEPLGREFTSQKKLRQTENI